MVRNIADFERNYSTYDVDVHMKDLFAFDPDLVVLAIGENVPSLGSEKRLPRRNGTLDSDFSRCANVSDVSHQAIDSFGYPGRVETIPPWRPADTRYDDRNRVSAMVGSYRPNPWGLFDMHGNVAEWTRSEYRPYPYRDDDGRNEVVSDLKGNTRKVARGGSWYDPPNRCRSAFRQPYLACQAVYDVGFRVICEPWEKWARETGPAVELH
jgi:hypothetical protein